MPQNTFQNQIYFVQFGPVSYGTPCISNWLVTYSNIKGRAEIYQNIYTSSWKKILNTKIFILFGFLSDLSINLFSVYLFACIKIFVYLIFFRSISR